MIGLPAAPKTEWIEQQVQHVASLSTPWGVGFMAWALEADLYPLEAFLDFGPSLVTLSFGDVSRAAALAHEAGVLTAMQVGNATDLERAMADDIDIIIARGGEGGGHGRNEAGTLPLLAAGHRTAAETCDCPPVVSAPPAEWRPFSPLGPPRLGSEPDFLAASEATGHKNVKDAVQQAGLDDTTYTRAFDVAQQLPWAPEFGGRALRNEFSDTHADLSTWAPDEQLRLEMQEARAEARTSMAPVYAGEAVQFIGSVQSAAEVMAELAGFRKVLADAASRFA